MKAIWNIFGRPVYQGKMRNYAHLFHFPKERSKSNILHVLNIMLKRILNLVTISIVN